MKRLEARVAKEASPAVESVLATSHLIYSKHDAESESGKTTVFTVIVPEEILGHTIDNISQQLDMRKNENLILVGNLDATISRSAEDLQKRAREETPSPSPLEAVTQPLARYLRPSRDIVTMLVVATAVALAGLFLNNVAVVIGAMLISPLVGPLNAVAVNALLGNVRDVLMAEASLFILVFVSIGVAAAITLVASAAIPLSLTSQIMARTHVTILDVIVAILLGVAGGLALLTELPEILVGVAVAVAFIPPTAVAGIALALGRLDLFAGAFFLTMSNLFGLKVGEMITLRAKGLSPRSYYEMKKARTYGLRSLVIFLLILALLAFLVVTVVH